MPEQPEGWDRLCAVLLALLPGGLWCVWFLWGVNWKKLAPVLMGGAWAAVVLLMLVAASAWSRIMPADHLLFDLVPIPNFWWQLGYVTALVLVALFCGWLQGVFGWTPREIDLEPPAYGHHDHGHGHDHGGHAGPARTHAEQHGHGHH